MRFREVDNFQARDGDQQREHGNPVGNDNNDIHSEVMKRKHSIYDVESGASIANVNAEAEEGTEEQTQSVTQLSPFVLQ